MGRLSSTADQVPLRSPWPCVSQSIRRPLHTVTLADRQRPGTASSSSSGRMPRISRSTLPWTVLRCLPHLRAATSSPSGLTKLSTSLQFPQRQFLLSRSTSSTKLCALDALHPLWSVQEEHCKLLRKQVFEKK